MKQTLNIDNFLEYAYNTGNYNDDQFIYLEGNMAQLSWKEYGLYSHQYITAILRNAAISLRYI